MKRIRRKRVSNLTAGDNLTLNWGTAIFAAQEGHEPVARGWSGWVPTWEITHDTGSAASSTFGQVHAVGGQLGLTYVPWVLSVNVHGFYEYVAVSRFQGGSFGVSIAKKFW